MGMCYDVNVKLIYDENKKQQIIESAVKFIDTYDADFVVNKIPETLDEIMRIIITDRDYESDLNNHFSSSFEGSYGWDGVMIEFFKSIANNLKDGSIFKIWPDFGHEFLTVKAGEVYYESDEQEILRIS